MCLSHLLSITFNLTSFTKTRPTPYFNRLTNLEMRSKHPGIGANSKSSLRPALVFNSGTTPGVELLCQPPLALALGSHPANDSASPRTWLKVCQQRVSVSRCVPWSKHDIWFLWVLVSLMMNILHPCYIMGDDHPFLWEKMFGPWHTCQPVSPFYEQPRFIESIPTSFFKTTRQVVVNFNLRFVKSSLSASIFTTTPPLQQWISSIPKEV